MKKIGLVLVATVALSGCSSPEQDAIWTVEKSVKSRLKDPGSAQFGKTYFVPDAEPSASGFKRGKVCGQVSGKNSYGAYAQPQHFVATAILGDGVLDVSNIQLEGHGIDSQAFMNVYWLPCKLQG